MATFKSYSEKSKARRALVQVYGIEKDATEAYLGVENEKHGFYLENNVPQMGGTFTETTVDVPAGSDVLEALGAPQTLVEAMKDCETTEEAPAPSADAFGGFAMGQLTAPSNQPAPEAARTSGQRPEGLKIEKNREERNGVKMPSTGGMCRAVWDTLNSMMTHDEATGLANVPSAADIKKVAEEKGWNVNNASIEYYNWRKFMGIKGRGKQQI